MLIFDWHLDLAWNALEWNRDLKLPVAEIRRRKIGSRQHRPWAWNQYGQSAGATRWAFRSRLGHASGPA